MHIQNLPKYTVAKHKGNVGEAVVQYVLSKFSLVHSIDGSNDLGNDFICELVKDQAPTNLLFYVQVKFTKTKPVLAKSTEAYWKASPLPVYVFWIKENNKPIPPGPERLTKRISYLRMTPKLHNPSRHGNEEYQQYDEAKFKRDLIVDYARTQYVKGFTPIVEPRDYLTIDEKNLGGIGQYVLYIKDVIPEYKNEILKRSWVHNFVVAELLANEGGVKNFQKAAQSLDLAISMVTDSDRIVLYSFYNGMIRLKEKLENEIIKQGKSEGTNRE